MNSRVMDGTLLTYLKRNNLVAPNKKPKVELTTIEPVEVGDKVVVVNKIIPKHFPQKGIVAISNGKSKNPVYEKYQYNGYKGNSLYLTQPAHKSRKLAGDVRYFFEGAYVEDPVPGRYGWLYSIDLESLYPSILSKNNFEINIIHTRNIFSKFKI